MNYHILETPIGALRLCSNGSHLTHIEFEGRYNTNISPVAHCDKVLSQACDQLNSYFSGGIQPFDLPLAPAGTQFQQQVWQGLIDIPYGELRSYKDLALSLGKPKAVRAVGAANGRNPLPIVIPCHRVIGSNGSLTGFAGGVDIKQQLLQLEGHSLSGGKAQYQSSKTGSN